MDIIFGDFLYHDELNIDLNSLEKTIYELDSKKESVLISNRGGRQFQFEKRDMDINLIQLHDEISIRTNKVANELKYPSLELANWWANINPKGSHNVSHSHTLSLLSGVFYIKTPSDCGKLNFFRCNSELFELYQDSNHVAPDTFNPLNSLTHSIEPTPNTLYIFPSYLLHDVDMNNNDEDRISISFNFIT